MFNTLAIGAVQVGPLRHDGWRRVIPKEVSKSAKKNAAKRLALVECKGEEEVKLDARENEPQSQREQCERLLNILDTCFFCIAKGMTGAGKTYVVSRALQLHNQERGLKTPMLVVGPTNTLKAWRDMAASYDVNILGFYGFPSLRGTKARKLSHPWLQRTDWVTREKFHTIFSASPELLSRLYSPQGLWIVVDECHSLRSPKSEQHRAVAALLRHVQFARALGFPSRIIGISATLATDPGHIVSLATLLGILQVPTSGTLLNPEDKKVRLGKCLVPLDYSIRQNLYGGKTEPFLPFHYDKKRLRDEAINFHTTEPSVLRALERTYGYGKVAKGPLFQFFNFLKDMEVRLSDRELATATTWLNPWSMDYRDDAKHNLARTFLKFVLPRVEISTTLCVNEGESPDYVYNVCTGPTYAEIFEEHLKRSAARAPPSFSASAVTKLRGIRRRVRNRTPNSCSTLTESSAWACANHG